MKKSTNSSRQRIVATRTFSTIQPEIHEEECIWRAPTPLTEAKCLADMFSLTLVPPSAKALVRIISNEGNTDPGYAAASLMAFISGGLSNLYIVQPEQDNSGWQVPPNLSGLLVGPASVQKSRGYRPVESFVKNAENEIVKEYSENEKELQAEYQLRKKQSLSREQLAQKKISESTRIESSDPVKSEELVAEAKELLLQVESDLEPPSPMTLIINDTTEAGLHKLKTKEFHCHFYVRDEAAPLFLDTMGRNQSKSKAFLIEAMDGDNDYRRNLKTENAGKASAPRITIFGTTQPSKIKTYLQDVMKDGLSNDGFLNRFQLLIYPDEKVVLDLPSKQSPETVKSCFKRVFNQLLRQRNLLIAEQKVVKFSKEAQPKFDKYKKSIVQKLIDYAETPMESHIGKYTGLVPCLALVCEFLSKIKPNQKRCPVVSEISLNSLTMAINWAAYLESHAKKVFGLENPNLAIAQQILSKRRELGRTFTVRDVYSKLRKPYHRNKTLTVGSLQYLETMGYVRQMPKSVNAKGGAPRQEWQFNPVLFKSQS